MPVIDDNAYAQAEAKQGGAIEQPKPGVYELKIMAVRTEWSERNFETGQDEYKTAAGEQAVLFVYDIASGEFEGEYSRDFYMDGGTLDPKKDFMHQVKYGWWDMGRLKQFNNSLAECNPGFDPMPALKADQWGLFVGKRFHAVLNGTVTTNDNGFDNWKLRCGAILTNEDIATGNYREPKTTDKRRKPQSGGSTGSSAPAVAGSVYGDIPL